MLLGWWLQDQGGGLTDSGWWLQDQGGGLTDSATCQIGASVLGQIYLYENGYTFLIVK